MKKPLARSVGTDDTLASKFGPEPGGHASAASAQVLVAAVPEPSGVADSRVIEHANIDSALMDTPTASGVRAALRKVRKDDAIAGVAPTRGTATL